ncbi:MAG: hypothetical protein ACYS8W_06445 [Planctomycetota bacterium]|jgi:hypothetical protein
MDQEERQDAPMTRSERIAQRKEAREEILAQMAEKKKKAKWTALIVGVPLAVIAIVIVIISFTAGTKIGKKTDWKPGDAFTFSEKWDKMVPPAKSSGRAKLTRGIRTAISGTCKVLDVAAGVPTKLEISVDSFSVKASGGITPGEVPEKFTVEATRSGPQAEWTYKPELHEYCPLRADFLLNCGLDIPSKKWRDRDEGDYPPPRWATPDFPAKDVPGVINYTCKGGSDVVKFKIAQHSFQRFVRGKVSIEGKQYKWMFEADGKADIHVGLNFITNFYFKCQGTVMNFRTEESRRTQNEPAPGFGIVTVTAIRHWQ